MSSNRTTIYLNGKNTRVLGNTAERTVSGRVNDVLDRYGLIIELSRRAVLKNFTADEMGLIRTVCQGWATKTEAAALLIGGIAANIEDGALPGGDIDGQDVSALLEKLTVLSPAEELALIEWLEG